MAGADGARRDRRGPDGPPAESRPDRGDRWYRDRRPCQRPTRPPSKRAVVALNGGPSDARIVRLVAEQARARTRPSSSPSTSSRSTGRCPSTPTSPAAPRRSSSVLDFAEAVAEESKQRLEPVLLQARDVGAAIVDEAAERGADLLVLGVPFRTRFGGEFAIGRTIPYILQNAPCAVWVVREPMTEEPVVKIVIVGCGRVGASIAEAYDAAGHEVLVIDMQTDAFDRLPTTFGGARRPRRRHRRGRRCAGPAPRARTSSWP